MVGAWFVEYILCKKKKIIKNTFTDKNFDGETMTHQNGIYPKNK